MSSVRRPYGRLFQNSPTGSAKASVSKAVVRTWHHTRYQRKTEGIVGCLRRGDGYHQPVNSNFGRISYRFEDIDIDA